MIDGVNTLYKEDLELQKNHEPAPSATEPFGAEPSATEPSETKEDAD